MWGQNTQRVYVLMCVCELQPRESIYCVRGLWRLRVTRQLTATAAATLTYYGRGEAPYGEWQRAAWGEMKVSGWGGLQMETQHREIRLYITNVKSSFCLTSNSNYF